MPIDISKEEFCNLEPKHMLAVLYENTQDIRSELRKNTILQTNSDAINKITRYVGGLWLFLLTVSFGLKSICLLCKMGKQWARGNFCTLAPDKLFGIEMGDCCFLHDIQYSKHGKIKSRKNADKLLRMCVEIEFIKKGKVKTGWIGWFYWKQKLYK